MPHINTAFRLYYAAKDYRTGLTDVQYYVYAPNGIRSGPYLMSELNQSAAAGVYYDDYLDATVEGNYLFLVDCPSHPWRAEQSYFFESKPMPVSSMGAFASAIVSGIFSHVVDSTRTLAQTLRSLRAVWLGRSVRTFTPTATRFDYYDETGTEIAVTGVLDQSQSRTSVAEYD